MMRRRMQPHAPPTRPGEIPRDGDRIFENTRHDPYQVAGKYAEPTRCGTCHAVFHRGRWQWAAAAEGGHTALCPACHRILDKLPAGEVTLEGPFVRAHRDDLVHLVRNEAEHERTEHPLNRIMDLEEGDDRVRVTTTDIHLPRRIGEALKRAYDGELDMKFGGDEYSVRVAWRR